MAVEFEPGLHLIVAGAATMAAGRRAALPADEFVRSCGGRAASWPCSVKGRPGRAPARPLQWHLRAACRHARRRR